MARRALVVLAVAAVLVLALVAPSAARRATGREPPGGWTLTLEGKTTKVNLSR